LDNEDESSIFLAKNDEDGDGKVVEKDAEDDKVARDDKAVEADKPDFIMPVYGNIIYDFAMDKLVYSKTLEDWRTHRGIDIAASRGTVVKASAGGIVCEVKNDPRLGNTIVIDHENGFKTVYANLASLDMVLPNQIVAQGEGIGPVGDTAIFEIALEPHLHFEVLENDKPVDPKLYLPDY
jgi:murein DD-endopeptidase MepM/ murein hydrolase activator NlpD